MRYWVVAALLTVLASCLTPSDPEAPADLETSSFKQELSVCTSTCDRPTYNGVPVSCASNYGCYGGSDGVICGPYWQFIPCEPDTPPSPCGNGTCEPSLGENTSSCSADCYCGNGTCDSGESAYSCEQDCGFCGDGYCTSEESYWGTCEIDCGGWCGQYQC